MYKLLSKIVSCNHEMHSCSHFIFLPGMEFGSFLKWWPSEGLRPTAHEGLDICYYRKGSSEIFHITPETAVPAMQKGVVRGICRDFLGHTLFIEHPHSEKGAILAAYAHVVPVTGLVAGDIVEEDELIAYVADTKVKKVQMDSHLHISFLDAKREGYEKFLKWESICEREVFELFDPLACIEGEGMIQKGKKA